MKFELWDKIKLYVNRTSLEKCLKISQGKKKEQKYTERAKNVQDWNMYEIIQPRSLS